VFINAEASDNEETEQLTECSELWPLFPRFRRCCAARLTGAEVQSLPDGIRLNRIISGGVMSSAVVVLSGEICFLWHMRAFEEY
jgi:hypothetical protein